MKRSLMFLFALVVSLAMLFTTQSTMATGPAPAPRPQSDPSIVGAWGPVTNLNSISSGAIVAIHTSLLPNGKVLVFTRQQASDGNDNVNGFSRTYVWDPATNSVVSEAFNGTTNLFCSGHAFIHDGRLLVTGGHLGGDLRGEPDANFYDWNTGAWSSAASMGRGRWYPTNVALGNSEMLVDAGFDEFQQINRQPQVWQTNNTWRPLSSALDPHSNTYPWLHLAPNGQVFHSGPAKETYYLRTSGAGQWTFVDNNRVNDIRDAGTSVTYDDGKVLIIGARGGNPMATLPRRECEMINLNVSPVISNTTTSVAPTPQWRRVGDMAFGSPPVERDATA